MTTCVSGLFNMLDETKGLKKVHECRCITILLNVVKVEIKVTSISTKWSAEIIVDSKKDENSSKNMELDSLFLVEGGGR